MTIGSVFLAALGLAPTQILIVLFGEEEAATLIDSLPAYVSHNNARWTFVISAVLLYLYWTASYIGQPIREYFDARKRFTKPQPNTQVQPTAAHGSNVYFLHSLPAEVIEAIANRVKQEVLPPATPLLPTMSNEPLLLARANGSQQAIQVGKYETILFHNVLSNPESCFNGETLFIESGGQYEFEIVLDFSAWDRKADSYEIVFVTSNEQFYKQVMADEMLQTIPIRISIIAIMNSCDTAECLIRQSGGNRMTVIGERSFWKCFLLKME